MNFFREELRRNRATILLIAATLILYAGIFLVSRSSEDTSEAPSASKKVERMSKESLHEREEKFKKNILEKPALAQSFSATIVLVLSAGFFMNAVVLRRKLRKQPIWPSAQSRTPAVWGFREVLLVTAFLFFMEAVMVASQFMGHYFFGLEWANTEVLVMANSLIRNLTVSVLILWLVCAKLKYSASDFGLSWNKFLNHVRLGLGGYLFMLPLLCISLLAVVVVAQHFSYEPAPQAVVEIYLKESSTDYLLFFSIFVAGLGPIFEEIFFRGFLLGGLRQKLGSWGAIAASSLIFAALHFNLAAFFPILILGVFLAVLAEKTGSLVPSMTVHVTHNLIMVCLTLWFRALSV